MSSNLILSARVPDGTSAVWDFLDRASGSDRWLKQGQLAQAFYIRLIGRPGLWDYAAGMLPLLKQVLDNFNLDVDPEKSREENADEVIKAAALLSGAIAVEPLPFADLLLITPVQLKMVLHIGKIYGFDITPQRAREIVAELGVTVAYGLAIRQVMRGVAKIVAPVIGGIVTAPLVYGWTFGLGRLAETYFQRKVQNLPFEKVEQNRVVQEAKRTTRRILPSADDFSQLAKELRKRAQDKEQASSDQRDLN